MQPKDFDPASPHDGGSVDPNPSSELDNSTKTTHSNNSRRARMARLSASEHHVMATVMKNPGRNLSDLHKLSQEPCDYVSFARRVQRLLDGNLLQKQEDTVNKHRIVRIYLTAQGVHSMRVGVMRALTLKLRLPRLSNMARGVTERSHHWDSEDRPFRYKYMSEDRIANQEGIWSTSLPEGLKINCIDHVDALGEALETFYDGNYAKAAIELDAAAHSFAPWIICELHWAWWVINVLEEAMAAAALLFWPPTGPTQGQELRLAQEAWLKAMARYSRGEDFMTGDAAELPYDMLQVELHDQKKQGRVRYRAWVEAQEFDVAEKKRKIAEDERHASENVPQWKLDQES